jgi:pimeloyl-ACP methyl ester carboxylesterase
MLFRYLLSFAVAVCASLMTTASARETPRLVLLGTGSNIATWTLPATPTLGALVHTTPIVFLHGGPGLYTEDRRIEQGQVFRNAGFTTIFYDQIGSGQSARPAASNYSLARMVADLEALRISLGIEKIVLWGNSWGCQLALLYAQAYPAHVAGLIFTSPGTVPGERPDRDYRLTKRTTVTIGRALETAITQIDNQGAAAEATVSQIDSGRLFDDLTRAELLQGMVCAKSTVTQANLPGGGNVFVNRIIAKEVARSRPNWSTLPRVPALIVRGECDFNSGANALRYQELVGGTKIDLPDIGHALLEDPTAVQTVLGDFARGPLAEVQ